MQHENIISMHFEYKSIKHKIKGLEVLKFEIKNQCSNINYLSSFNWCSNRWESIKHQITMRLQGGYYADDTQSYLLKMACIRSELKTTIAMPTKQQVTGNFIITEYEIISDYDDSSRFQFEIKSAGPCSIN